MTHKPADPPLSRVDPGVVVAALAQMVLGEQSLDQTLQQVVGSAKRALPDVEDASVTLLADQHPQTAAFTGRSALQLDERQYHDGSGPCLDAAATGHTVTVTTRRSNPYPAFSWLAQKFRIGGVVCTPLCIPDRVLGALNLYLRHDWPPHHDYVAVAETFAGYAAAHLANAALHQQVVDLSRQLTAALTSRSVIEQAKGILMAQHHCSSDAAFSKLVETARQRHLKVIDTAAAITTEIDTH